MKKLIQLVISVALILLAFQKIDVRELLLGLLNVPLLLVIFTIVYSFFSMVVSSWRWGIILLKAPKWADVLFLVKCNYLALFYSLSLPSSMSGDLFRWMPLVKRYPEKGKLGIAGSVLIDRVVGASAFFPVALIAGIIGKMMNFSFPDYLLLIFGLGCLVIVVFYLGLHFINLEGVSSNNRIVRNLIKVVLLIKNEDTSLLLQVFLVSILVQLVGIFPVWVRSQFLDVGFSLLSVYIFIPIVSLVLMLPISIAGFGAREQLFLFFFMQTGVSAQKIMLVSAFSGVANILLALMGGLFLTSSLFRSVLVVRKKS